MSELVHDGKPHIQSMRNRLVSWLKKNNLPLRVDTRDGVREWWFYRKSTMICKDGMYYEN